MYVMYELGGRLWALGEKGTGKYLVVCAVPSCSCEAMTPFRDSDMGELRSGLP